MYNRLTSPLMVRKRDTRSKRNDQTILIRQQIKSEVAIDTLHCVDSTDITAILRWTNITDSSESERGRDKGSERNRER